MRLDVLCKFVNYYLDFEFFGQGMGIWKLWNYKMDMKIVWEALSMMHAKPYF
jgi:hypothetical protein